MTGILSLVKADMQISRIWLSPRSSIPASIHNAATFVLAIAFRLKIREFAVWYKSSGVTRYEEAVTKEAVEIVGPSA